MPFDRTWEAILRDRTWGRYPSEHVVRFVARRFFGAPDRSAIRFLDLGCGGGAHSWFLAREGFSVTAVDGSAAGVEQTRALLARDGYTAELSVCEFLNLPFPDASFDAVLDCAAVQHNPWAEIVAIHRVIHRILKPGGAMFSMMVRRDESEERSGDVPVFHSGSNPTGIFIHQFSRAEVDQLLASYAVRCVDTLDRTDSCGSAHVREFIVSGQKALS